MNNQIPENSYQEQKIETAKAQILQIEPANRHNLEQAQEHLVFPVRA